MRKHRFLSTFLSAALAIVCVTAPLPEMGIELEVPMTTDAVTYTELTDIPRNIDGNYAMPSGYYKLMNDITLDGYLGIYNSMVIDLNGHNIDRGLDPLTSGEQRGSILEIYRRSVKVTIQDSVGTGKLTDGHNSENAGGIFVDSGATLNIEGGNIIGNCADGDGGAIYINVDGTVNMSGGSITGNTANSAR